MHTFSCVHIFLQHSKLPTNGFGGEEIPLSLSSPFTLNSCKHTHNPAHATTCLSLHFLNNFSGREQKAFLFYLKTFLYIFFTFIFLICFFLFFEGDKWVVIVLHI